MFTGKLSDAQIEKRQSYKMKHANKSFC